MLARRRSTVFLWLLYFQRYFIAPFFTVKRHSELAMKSEICSFRVFCDMELSASAALAIKLKARIWREQSSCCSAANIIYYCILYYTINKCNLDIP